MKRGAVVALALTIVAVALIGIWARLLFGTRSFQTPLLGSVTLHLSWGRLQRGSLDRNGDGLVDGRIQFDGGDPDIPHSFQWARQWDDADFDGVFELYSMFVMRDDGVERVLAIDNDDDGRYEQVLFGDDAASTYRERVYTPQLERAKISKE